MERLQEIIMENLKECSPIARPLWLKELLANTGDALLRGTGPDRKVINCLNDIPEKTMNKILDSVMDDNRTHLEYHIMSYNKHRVQHYITLMAEDIIDNKYHEEFLEDMDDEADGILAQLYECEAIRQTINNLKLSSVRTRVQFNEDVYHMYEIIAENLYIRPELAECLQPYHLIPNLIENMPILIPLEEEEIERKKEMEVLRKKGAFNISQETQERIHLKIFGTNV